ncbi:toll-like receptor 7 [Alosa sapidissima]|uniref:toll-like receptor 7 n=1 Tax=Alosa sapidissima TaxID=34773 RepID=UPI001C0A61E0|nr:toll-like receptor 7 [Alosa sapidissima]
MVVKAIGCALVLLPVMVAAVWYPKSLPCEVSVVSNGSEVSVNCTQVGLEYIPFGIPKNTTNLTLTINRIPHINISSFVGLENLTEIDMRCNCVPVKVGPKDHVCNQRVTIESGSFRRLKNLKSLYLDGNQLTSIPKHLPKGLVLLSLEVNNIASISKENLTELRHIETLYLGQNCYFRNPCNESYKVDDDAFLQMERMTLLSLKANNLSTIPQRLPSSLKELYLYNNNIHKITEEDFQNLTNLETLDLSGNCPRCYNAPYPCEPCPNNAPLQIDYKAFKNLNKLQILRLHSNSLTKVHPQWFQGCSNLKVLDLSSNYLAQEISVTRFPTSLPKLEELDLSFNYELQKYPASLNLNESFSGLKSLQILRIRGLVFQQLTEKDINPLVSLENLRMIDLGFNFIKITDLSILAKLKHVHIINLSENKISTPTENAILPDGYVGHSLYSNPTLHNAQYYNREVREIHYFRYDEFARSCKHKDKELGVVSPLNTECTQRGKTLDISRNNIFFLHSGFLNLHLLKCLNLSGNAMSQSLNGSEFKNLENLEYLDFSSNRLDTMYSSAFSELTKLVVLDISYNNHYFEAEGLTHMLNFTKNLSHLQKLLMNYNQISTSTNTEMESFSLEHLEFKGNRLDMLWRDGDTRYINYFSKLLNLKKLYISENNLNFIPEDVLSDLPEKLTELHINKNKLTTFPWDKLADLKLLELLDLSENLLTEVPKTLSNHVSLKELILCKNHISEITPLFLANITTLRVLDLSYNEIQHIDQSSFPEDAIKKLDTLYLNNNKFLCTCRAIWFVMWLNRTSVHIPQLATDVKCAAPGEQEGKMVISLYLPACQENSLSIILYILLNSLTLCFIALSISSHLFLWDVWYIYHFVSAKLKGYKRMDSDSTFYDAFIVYDRKDSAVCEWVMQELRVHLEEQGDPALQLCLEERDWIPGWPLIDNISQSIQQSRRTVFILTNSYMKSGDFKTAFYLAHQRLMDEKNDVIVLIFLEKIPCNSKYLRLRRRLYKRSVLEWPQNPQAQQYFWHCLRSVMVTDSQKHYSTLFQEIL